MPTSFAYLHHPIFWSLRWHPKLASHRLEFHLELASLTTFVKESHRKKSFASCRLICLALQLRIAARFRRCLLARPSFSVGKPQISGLFCQRLCFLSVVFRYRTFWSGASSGIGASISSANISVFLCCARAASAQSSRRRLNLSMLQFRSAICP